METSRLYVEVDQVGRAHGRLGSWVGEAKLSRVSAVAAVAPDLSAEIAGTNQRAAMPTAADPGIHAVNSARWSGVLLT